MKILLGNFNVKVGRQSIFNLTIGNKCVHQDSNGNSVRIVKFATSKNLVSEVHLDLSWWEDSQPD
jgi:hypothetical protein